MRPFGCSYLGRWYLPQWVQPGAQEATAEQTPLKALALNHFSEDSLSPPCAVCYVCFRLSWILVLLCDFFESFASVLLLAALSAALAPFAAGWVADLEGRGVSWGSDFFQ